jgi:putative inorganic carbon (HCO3(-)) transporter
MPKTIFGTTEKSNFILNMKDDTIERLPLICVKVLAIIGLVGQATPELIEVIAKLTGNGSGWAYGFLNTPFICLAITWVTAIIMLVIMGARQRFSRQHHQWLVVLLALGVVWAIVSAITSFSPLDSFNGLYGRTTGVLTILACVTILLLMSFNTKESNLKSMVRVLVITSAVQCGWGLIQVVSYCLDAELSYYEDLNSISLYSVCLPSGFSGSPIFFAEYLGIMLGLTLTLACIEKSKLYMVMSLVYTYLMLDTHTVVGVVGSIVVIVAVLVTTILHKGERKNVLPIVLCIVVGAITVAVSFVLDGKYIFYDGAIMWQDSFYRLGSTGYYWKEYADFDITNVKEVFAYIWGSTISLIKKYPIVGTGQDCLIFAQMYAKNLDSTGYVVNGFDLAYNDYLNVAGTMGIPALVVYVVTLVFSYVKVCKRLKDSNVFKGLLVSMVGFTVMSMFSTSAITVMPYISMVLGLACSKKFDATTTPTDTTAVTEETEV